jgi:predicted DNA-binding WGR domain protein
MTSVLPDLLRLTRRDPERNMARFYALALEPTLFGEVTLLRTWGRIGTRGQVRIETFGEADDAVVAREKLERAKRKKGYRV